jgi:hypothetical protein
LKHFLFGHDFLEKGALDRGPDENDLVYDVCLACGIVRWRMGGLKVSVIDKAFKDLFGDSVRAAIEKACDKVEKS